MDAAGSEGDQALRGCGVALARPWPPRTIPRPATFMEMFVRPSIWFAGWTSDCFLGAVRPDTQLSLVAVRDIGAAAAAAFADPARFDGVHLELAGDVRSLREVAAVMSDVKPVAASWTGPSRTLAAAFTGRRAP